MRTLLIAAVAVMLLAGWALVVYGIGLSWLALTPAEANGAAVLALLGTGGAALVMFALAGARGRL